MTSGAVASDSGEVEDGAMILRVEDRLPVVGRRWEPFDYYGDREWRLCSLSTLMIKEMEWQNFERKRIYVRYMVTPLDFYIRVIPQAHHGNFSPPTELLFLVWFRIGEGSQGERGGGDIGLCNTTSLAV